MTATSATSHNRANFVTADHCGNRRRALRLNSAVMQKSRDIFPLKTALHLSEITGYSLRSCEYWLSEKSVMPADALAALIQSDWGRDFLTVSMMETTPRWWITFKAHLKRITYEAAEALQAKKYRELLDEEAQARSHRATPIFQDDPFYEGQPAPHRQLDSRRRR